MTFPPKRTIHDLPLVRHAPRDHTQYRALEVLIEIVKQLRIDMVKDNDAAAVILKRLERASGSDV